MSRPRIGIWFIGAFGGVATTAALGLSALRRRLTDRCGLVTALPLFDGLDLDEPGQFIIGGHDIRHSSFQQTARELHERSGVFEPSLLEACAGDLETWTANVRTGTIANAGSAIAQLADGDASAAETPRSAIERIQRDIRGFREAHRLDQLVVINVASTEPPLTADKSHERRESLVNSLESLNGLPASCLYAWAAIDLGLPYVNFTPSAGASLPALMQMAEERGVPIAGKDGKTGETLLKTVLAPMFAARNLQVLSWVGHNIFGNRDGLVLDDPHNKESKLRSKDEVVSRILGYRPQTHVSIEYIESLDDWKTAWDHIHFRGFLGVKMALQFTWQGCDSLLAAPLVIDLARLTLLAQRRGERGILRHLACFFKNPMGVTEHDFFKQFALLEAFAAEAKATAAHATERPCC
jgi:myo-inositol-1-phosphate synthase